MSNQKSHGDRILKHLETYWEITQLDALALYSCMRLSAVIHELKKKGHNIETEMVLGKNKFDRYIRYAKYLLK